MGVNTDDAPGHVHDAIVRLRAQLAQRPEVASAALYGSFVRGGYRADASDINLALVLRGDALTTLGEPLRAAWRAARIEPWIVRLDELAGLADAFATRVRDIQRAHRVIVGDDVWSALVVPRTALRLRIEQELRNHQLRLRHAWVLGDAAAQARQLYSAAGALRLDLSLLEELCGGGVHEAIEPLAVAIAERLALPRADVHSVLELRMHPAAATSERLAAASRLLDRAVAHVDSLEVT